MPDDGRDWKKTGGNTHYNLRVIEQCENASSLMVAQREGTGMASP